MGSGLNEEEMIEVGEWLWLLLGFSFLFGGAVRSWNLALLSPIAYIVRIFSSRKSSVINISNMRKMELGLAACHTTYVSKRDDPLALAGVETLKSYYKVISPYPGQ